MILCCNKMAKRYPKRPGTSGILGPLYESKLLSLIYFRAIHDDNIEEFHLASNVHQLGSFDDICFKVKFKDKDKALAVFLQAKHREKNDSVLKLKECDLVEYFNSYLKVRCNFNPNNEDVLFNSTLDETKCLFVIYTNAKGDKKGSTYTGSFSKNLNDLIGTGDSGSQLDVKLLCEIISKEQIKALARQMAKFICDNKPGSEISIENDLMKCYHVILALNVLDVSEILYSGKPEGHRIASFKQDFFTTKDEFLVLFKNRLCLEVLQKLKSEDTDIQSLLLKFLTEPSDVKTLSKLLIGNILEYKNDKLEFVGKTITNDLKRQLDKANVPQSTVYEAAELAAKEYLLSLTLKVPALFGNKDLAIRGNDDKIQKRLNHLTTKIKEILKQPNPSYIVTIDESSGDGFLQLNGGIASAVGNILVLDETSNFLKFSDTDESLGNLAKKWYETLKKEILNLHEYRFDVKVKLFPKLSFATDEYNKIIVTDFLNTLLFFTSQYNEKEVENFLIQEISNSQGDDVQHVKVASDAIYLKYHDEIQRWSMESDVGTYLDKEGTIYKDAVKHAKTQPLMSVINMIQKNNNVMKDDIKLIDMSAEWQKQILENKKVIFQGNEVNLRQFLNNTTIGYIEGDVLYKIMHIYNENTVGRPIRNFNYKPELFIQRHVRPFCRNARIQKSVDHKHIQTLDHYINFNLERNVVVIFGDPGMGKSSLLTQFSLKIKEEERGHTSWIVRVNLLEHTTQFRIWKFKNTNIDSMESLKFLCQVALSEESGKTIDMNISLAQCDDGTVFVRDFQGDAWTLFELRMFLNFYNSTQLIILLDGFDEICPTYENEVLALIKAARTFSKTDKIWVTSRSNDKMLSIFENLKFCKLLEIEPLTVDEQYNYLFKFWDEKMILTDLNDNQIKNICDCILYVSRSTHIHYVLTLVLGRMYKEIFRLFNSNMPYVLVGLSLIKYINEKRSIAPAAMLQVIDNYFKPKETIGSECLATPLHLNIMADYYLIDCLAKNIKPKNEYTIIEMYKYYLERKLKVRFQEKTQNDMTKPDNISAFEREYAVSIFTYETDFLLNILVIFITSKLKLEKYTYLLKHYSYITILGYMYMIPYYIFDDDWTLQWHICAFFLFFVLISFILFNLGGYCYLKYNGRGMTASDKQNTVC